MTTPLAVRKLAHELDIDVLHGHGAKGGLYARLAGGRGKAWRSTRRMAACCIYQPGRRGTGLPPSRAQAAAAHRCDDLRERLCAGAPTGADRQAELPRPGDPQRADAGEFEPVPPAPDARDFVFIGEFREVKGIHFLLEALADVKAPDGRPATLCMAGGGPDCEAGQGPDRQARTHRPRRGCWGCSRRAELPRAMSPWCRRSPSPCPTSCSRHAAARAGDCATVSAASPRFSAQRRAASCRRR